MLKQAGIASEEFPDQLLVALEPEAASIYVRRLRMHQLVPEKPERRPLSPRKQEEPDNFFKLDRVGDEIRDGLYTTRVSSRRFMHHSCVIGTVCAPLMRRRDGL